VREWLVGRGVVIAVAPLVVSVALAAAQKVVVAAVVVPGVAVCAGMHLVYAPEGGRHW
jgi:hypothetical protein